MTIVQKISVLILVLLTNICFIIRMLSGCLDSLKEFVCNELGLHGHWISPGGQVKEFASSCKGYALKWQGKTRNKLAVIRDDDERSLTAKLKRLASLTKDRGNEQDGVTNDAERIAINNNAVEKNLSIDRSNVESNPVELNKVIEKDSSTERNDMGLNSAKFSCGLNNANFVCQCSEFELQMRRVEKDVQYLMQRVKDQELKRNYSDMYA